MDREEAKHILSLCRPGSDEDWHDPVIAGALELIEGDGELRDWFEAEQAEDLRITAELGRIEPPAGLKASILAGMRAHALQPETETETEAPEQATDVIDFEELANRGIPAATKKPARRISPWAGIAALVAVLFVIGIVRQNQSGPEQIAQTSQSTQNDEHTTLTAAATVTPDLVNFLADQIEGLMAGRTQLEQLNDQIAPLTAHLASSGAPVPNKIPVDLDQLPTLGCITLDYHDSKLSIICFKGNEVVYHLVTAPKAAVHAPLSTEPQYFETKGQAFKLWSEGEQAFILTTKGSKDQLPELI